MEPQKHMLLPEETVMSDDANVYPGYLYIVDSVFTRYELMRPTTIGDWKQATGAREIRRCEIFGHKGARLGDRVVPAWEGVCKEDFAFTVTIGDRAWDVYRFLKNGKPGTLAFSKDDAGKFVIGLFRAGTLNEQQVKSALDR
jgi:hypothetical protein